MRHKQKHAVRDLVHGPGVPGEEADDLGRRADSGAAFGFAGVKL
jgi:hypothetical protein